MRSVLWVVLVAAGVLVAAAARADDKKAAEAGLEPGKDEIGGPFRPYNLTGKDQHRGKFHSLVSEYGLDPVVAVFVRGTDPNKSVLDLLDKLDTLVQKNERLRLHAFVVFLSDDMKDVVRDDAKREAAAAALFDKMKGLGSLAAALDVPGDVRDGYKLSDKAEVTVIFYNKYRVELDKAYPAKALDEAAVKALLEEINAKLDALRPATAKAKKKP